MEIIKGQVISGEFSKILIRKKSSEKIEIGELLVSETEYGYFILQVFDLEYGSQISRANLEMVSGYHLEEDSTDNIMDENMRTYIIAYAKPLIMVSNKHARLTKSMPDFLSKVRAVKKGDLHFMRKPKKELYLGTLRSGSSIVDVDILLDGEKVFSHHILVPATTGRGKSNLTKVLLWEQLDKDYCGVLVLDPHDEYYGRNSFGLKDHPEKESVVYYTPTNVPVGQRTLKFNIESLTPGHFNGVAYFSDPQKQAMGAYFSQYKNHWIRAIVYGKKLANVTFHDDTINVLKRRMISLLSLEIDAENNLHSTGIFDTTAAKTTVADICDNLESSKTVVIDTSSFTGAIEILVGSLITTEIFKRYKRHKTRGTLKDKPVVSVVLEEAPRVLGKEVLMGGSNIFSTIAREGRKFRVGLMAITQLPSLIGRDILANMNTKIILGLELASERNAIIESAAQDLSTDSRSIASLDIGEAIVTSNFARFAIPIKIPYFDDLVIKTQNEAARKKNKDFGESEDRKSTEVQKMIEKREVADSFAGVKLK